MVGRALCGRWSFQGFSFGILGFFGGEIWQVGDLAIVRLSPAEVFEDRTVWSVVLESLGP